MKFNYEALVKNNTRELVLHPNRVKIARCKWVSKSNSTVYGSINKCKPQLVASGISQKEDKHHSGKCPQRHNW